MLRFKIRHRHRNLSGTYYPSSGPVQRIWRLRSLVSAVIRHERIESNWSYCDETRGYVERLIQLAIRNGDRHKETMEIADYWLDKKDLIHKLFKVLVPRYQNYSTSLTIIHRLPTEYPGIPIPMSILELKGNPWPPVTPRRRDMTQSLTNILIQEARLEYRANKYKEISESMAPKGDNSLGSPMVESLADGGGSPVSSFDAEGKDYEDDINNKHGDMDSITNNINEINLSDSNSKTDTGQKAV